MGNEALSGHGVFGYGDHNKSKKINTLDTEHLALAAREIGLSVGMVGWCMRLSELAERIVSDLEQEVDRFRTESRNRQSISLQSHQWTQELSSAVHFLNSAKKIVWNFQVEAKDLDNRVKAQSGIVSLALFHSSFPVRRASIVKPKLTFHKQIFALISNRHAEAARNDSSSMKTVAVMTMAFLPATFFAALFALPSLDWKGPAVITNTFWIYWVFTIPTTILVFIIWGMFGEGALRRFLLRPL